MAFAPAKGICGIPVSEAIIEFNVGNSGLLSGSKAVMKPHTPGKERRKDAAPVTVKSCWMSRRMG